MILLTPLVYCDNCHIMALGNVAHDLRTPLQAFQSEMEILRNKIKHRLNDQTCLLSSMEQLDRICNFMNMTINRSIDFTKASSGIKLNPSIELINFSETMNWAVGCMVQSHAKVPIVFLPIPRSICNQIYTDKQWLMENMLCLLSNAQKFTTEGAITIRCSLDGSLHGAVVPQSTAFEPNSVGQITDDIPDVETGLSRTQSVTAPRQSQYVDSPGDNITEVEEISLMLLIEVEDTGIGITKENEGRLFKPFMQVKLYPLTNLCIYRPSTAISQLCFHALYRVQLTPGGILCLGCCNLHAGSAKNGRHWSGAVRPREANGKSWW